jgi:hypothetical protein
MTWFQDLTQCIYFGDEVGSSLLAIGWLERDKTFPTGLVDSLVYSRLCEFRIKPWQPMVSMGFHVCSLCWYEGATGSSNVFIPGNGIVFVCPELIVHYMDAHGYAPPQEFCEAVLACPSMHSMQYLKKILANGGRSLVRRVFGSHGQCTG